MNKIKAGLQSLIKHNPNKFFNNKIKVANTKHTNLIFSTCFSFSEIHNSKNKNINSRNSLKDNVTNRNNIENLTKIRRHEKKSDFNKDQFNRVKIDPNDESFYGLPISQSIPKNEEDLINKLSYLQSVDDFIDLYTISEVHFSANSLTKFLEKLFYVHVREMKKLIQKGKEQNFVFKSEANIKTECENRINLFLEKIMTNLIAKKESFSNKELMGIAFEFVYRYKQLPPQEIIDTIKNIIKYEELKSNDNDYAKNDILKFSFLLTKFDSLKLSLEEAQKTYDDLANLLIKRGLENLTNEEIKNIIFNFTRNKLEPNVELFTLLEPYILREINNFEFKSLIHIFSAYIKSFRGSDFFIKTLGFHLGARLKEASIQDVSMLLNISHNKYFKAENLTCKFEDFFSHKLLIEKVIGSVNEIQKIHFFSIIPGLINLGNADRKNFQVLSTVFLRFCERLNFQELIKLAFFFTLVDYENETLYKKIIDVLKLQMMCIKNYLDGNENMKNMIGLIDTKLLDKLDNEVSKSVKDITWSLKNFKLIQTKSHEINNVMDNLTKLIWILTYTSIKHIDAFNLNSLTELIKDSIVLFNNYITELNDNVLNNSDSKIKEEIYLSKENLNILLLSYVYLNNEQKFSNMKIPNSNSKKASSIDEKKEGDGSTRKTKSLGIKIKNTDVKAEEDRSTPMLSNNLNIEFLTRLNIVDYDMINNIEYKKYIVFAKLIEFNLKNRMKILESDTSMIKSKNFIRFNLNLDASIKEESVIENFNFFKEKFNGVKNIDKEVIYFLDPTYHTKTLFNEALKDQLVFLNQPYDYFKISDSVSGKVKVRRELCKRLKINYIEYDFYEFLNYSNMREADFQLTQDNFEEYSERIDEYITVKNEVFTK